MLKKIRSQIAIVSVSQRNHAVKNMKQIYISAIHIIFLINQDAYRGQGTKHPKRDFMGMKMNVCRINDECEMRTGQKSKHWMPILTIKTLHKS